MIPVIEKLKNGGMRYSNVRIDEIPSEKFPSMVVLSKGPSRISNIIGKRFVNLQSAVISIDVACTESMVIAREKYKAVRDLRDSGVVDFDDL
jgi:hypothetical protein